MRAVFFASGSWRWIAAVGCHAGDIPVGDCDLVQCAAAESFVIGSDDFGLAFRGRTDFDAVEGEGKTFTQCLDQRFLARPDRHEYPLSVGVRGLQKGCGLVCREKPSGHAFYVNDTIKTFNIDAWSAIVGNRENGKVSGVRNAEMQRNGWRGEVRFPPRQITETNGNGRRLEAMREDLAQAGAGNDEAAAIDRAAKCRCAQLFIGGQYAFAFRKVRRIDIKRRLPDTDAPGAYRNAYGPRVGGRLASRQQVA